MTPWRDPFGLIKVKSAHNEPIFVQKNDADHQPSKPHGHIGSKTSPFKVNVYTGEIFKHTEPTGKSLSPKGLAVLQNALKKAGFLGLAIKVGEFTTAPSVEAFGNLLDPGFMINGELSQDDMLPLPLSEELSQNDTLPPPVSGRGSP